MTVSVFGIRHHGPGSARSLAAALAELRPDVVLIEGPPEADGIVGLAAHPEMRPPVAILVHPPEMPGRAAFYPFAAFSPEWQAMRHAHSAGVQARPIPRSRPRERLTRPLPARARVLLLITGWFRRHPEERGRVLDLEEARRQCRRMQPN